MAIKRLRGWLVLPVAAVLVTFIGPGSPAHADTTGSITGHVTEGGAARGGVEVRVLPEEGGAPVATAVTDANGGYAVPDLADGRYKVGFVSPGTSLVEYAPRQPQFSRAEVFDIHDSAAVVDEELLPVGTIAGTITDQSGGPAGNAGVAATIAGEVIAFARTGADGTYRLTVFAGAYVMSVTREGFQTPQFMPGKKTAADAGQFSVAAGGTTIADEVLLPMAALVGRLTNADGSPEAGAVVHVSDLAGNGVDSAITDADGRYRTDGVFLGTYRVLFQTFATNQSQYAFGATTAAAAAQIAVTAAGDVVVDDVLLRTGSIEVTASDAVTGAPLTDFCADAQAEVNRGFGCADQGVVTLTGLAPGSYVVNAFPSDDGHFLAAITNVKVVAEQTVRVNVAVAPAAVITTKIVDAKTGAPVPGACVLALALRFGGMPEDNGPCSDETGAVRLGRLQAGTYTLFATPADETHGAQWVGATGGTGSQYRARQIRAKAGQVTEVPPIRLDPSGSITGRITDKRTGTPIVDACASPVPLSPDATSPHAGCTGADGRYTLTGLGPYDWPVEFTARDHAWQWSGGTANRLVAVPVKVRAGHSATANAAMGRGTIVTGNVLDAHRRPIADPSVLMFNTVTGDNAGFRSFSGSRYQLPVFGPQTVFVKVDLPSPAPPFWYNRARSENKATPVLIAPGDGKQVLDLREP